MVVGRMKLKLTHILFFCAFIITSEKCFVSTQDLSYQGNVTVVGLFEIYEPENGGCGTTVVPASVMGAEAVKWFFSRLNGAGYLNLKLGLHGYKTCRDDGQAARVAIDVAYKSANMDNITIIGVIGPEFSSEVEAIAPIFNSVKEDSRLLMVGYSTTSESLNKSQYPNFFRVVPNDKVQVEVMVESMLIMEWNRIAIIYEDDTYGQQAMQSLKQLSETNNICVGYTASIKTANGINSAEIEQISTAMLLGSSKRTSIGGFVFFGTATTAHILLQKMNSLGFSDVPIGMFSEGINMNLNAFQNFDKIISKTKGSLITSPTYRVISEFQSHWKTIFTDKPSFDTESETNPWLRDVYAHIKGCDTGEPCEFSPLTDVEFEASFPEQPLYIQYALMAAHAIAKTFDTVYRSHCPDNSVTCDFFSKFHQGQMIETMKDVRLVFGTDFPSFNLASMTGVEMTFEETGEADIDDTSASYQLFNLRHVNVDDGDVTFVKVGDFKDGRMNLNPRDIIDYPDDVAQTWPDVRKGQCDTKQICGECIPSNLPFMHLHDPGDLYIVGLVPVFDKSGTQDCGEIRPYHGYQLVEAIRFAVKKFNEPGSIYSEYFQGAKIGLIVFDTCNNPAVIDRKILNLHKEGLRLPNGSLIEMERRVLGYAGPLASEISLAVSRVFVNLRKVSIAYAATSPALNDKGVHKYFMRVVSSASEQTVAMANILEELDANYIQVLYSEGAYGEGGMAALRAIMKTRRVCIVQDIKVPEGNNYYQYYNTLRRYPHAKIVIIFLRSHVVGPLMQTLKGQMTRGEFMFIGSQAWAVNTDILEDDPNKSLLGSFSIALEMAQNNELLSHVQQQIKPQPYSLNPWSETFLQTKWQCHYSTSFDKRYSSLCEENYSSMTTLDSSSTAAYFSALSMLIGSGSFMKAVCGINATEICEDYLNDPVGLVKETQNKVKLDIYGDGINQRMFNDNGDGNVGYAIYNIQRDPDNPQRLRYKQIGRYPLIGSFTFDKSLMELPTEEGFVSKCPNEQACANCFDTSAGQVQPDEDNGNLSAPVIVLLVLFLICFAASMILAILLYRQRRQINEDQQMYLTPHTPGNEHSDYFEMPPSSERPAGVGASIEPCTERPHRVTPDPSPEDNGYIHDSPTV